MFAFATLSLALGLLAQVHAAVTPTSPESATTVRIGQPLTALWTADTTGQWTDMTVQLMTGDNLNMIPLTVLSTGIDGTKDTSRSWTTPNVSPTSKIYFLQFTRTGDPSTAQWTTRFTIAAADGSTTPPANSTTYTAAQGPIQWGVGAIVGGGGSGTSSNGTVATLPISNTTSPTSSAPDNVRTGGTPVAATQSSTTSSATSASASASTGITSASRATTTSASGTAAAAAATSSRAAAGRLEVGAAVGVLAGVVGALLL